MTVVDIDNVFPEHISFGAVGGPEFLTDVVQLRSGGEHTNSPWSEPLRTYDCSFGVKSVQQLTEYTTFFMEAHGQLYSFRFKDWADYKTTENQLDHTSGSDQFLGTGDGATQVFPCYKRYSSNINRRILLPRGGTVVVTIDGSEVDSSEWFIHSTSGNIVFLEAPYDGASVRWGGEFDVPVRFTSDSQPITLNMYHQGNVQTLGFREKRLSEPTVEGIDSTLRVLEMYDKESLAQLGNIVDYTVNTHWRETWQKM